MDTKMVRGTFGYTMSTIEEGAEAVVRLAVSPEVEGVTGRERRVQTGRPTTGWPDRYCGT